MNPALFTDDGEPEVRQAQGPWVIECPVGNPPYYMLSRQEGGEWVVGDPKGWDGPRPASDFATFCTMAEAMARCREVSLRFPHNHYEVVPLKAASEGLRKLFEVES